MVVSRNLKYEHLAHILFWGFRDWFMGMVLL